MTLKLITLDLDNTLWPVDEVIRRAEQASYQWLADTHPEVAARYDIPALIRLRQQLVRDNPDYLHNLTALRKAALAGMFEEAGFSHQEARREAEKAFAVFHQARNQVTLFPDVRTVLEVLAQHYQLGALTNGNADLKLIGLDDLFLFQHSSESIGRRKPEPDMFHAALKSAGVAAHQALHLGDHPEEDVDAARRHGFHAIWANLLQQSWPESLPPPDISLTQWRDLPTLLEALQEKRRT